MIERFAGWSRLWLDRLCRYWLDDLPSCWSWAPTSDPYAGSSMPISASCDTSLFLVSLFSCLLLTR